MQTNTHAIHDTKTAICSNTYLRAILRNCLMSVMFLGIVDYM